MPRISGPELRPDWIGTGSAGRDRLAGSVASGPMDRSEMPKGWSSMAGFVCLPFGNVVALGVRCVLGQPRAGAVRGVVRPVGGVWRYRGQRGWLAGWIGLAIDQSRHSGRSAAQTRNPCPVERDWIPAVAGMTIWLGGLCQRSGVGWLAGLALAIDHNRHSGRGRAQTRNPCPVAGDGIAAPLSRGQALRELCLEGMLSVSCSAA
jgi:hypothetical protein